jgi:diguanylate cyclase (GGDEF)-like protein
MQFAQEAAKHFGGEPSSPPADRCSDDVVEMLRVKASDELPAWLAERLAAMFPRTRQRVLRVYPGKAARSRSHGRYAVFSMADPGQHQAPILIGIDAMVVEAIGSRRTISIATVDGGDRMLVSLAAAGEVRYLVELVGRIEAEEAGNLCTFTSIAAGYFDRLVDAETDPLTRLCNRRVFHSHVDTGLRRWTASGRAYFLAVLDIDRFKRINDDFGHLYGDEILVHFANLLRHSFRAGDLLYRFGGEEFVLIYAADTAKGGEQTVERFRAAVESYDFPGVGTVTVSIGFTRITDAATPSATLIDRADQAVYYAKENGRNRVCSWETLEAAGEIATAIPANKDVTLF